MAQGRKTSLAITLTIMERNTLESWQRSTTISAGLARRGRIILLVTDGKPITDISRIVGIRRRFVYKWVDRFLKQRIEGLYDKRGRGKKPFFLPNVAINLVKLACERPDKLGRSLSQWDCAELRRQLITDGIVKDISISTVRRILEHHKLKPWRHHMWLSPKHPRDEAFYDAISGIIELYTRPLLPCEIVLSVDEKTSLQPRTRLHATKPAQRGNIPNRVEHEYERKGALQLFAAFNTRNGKVYGKCYNRKRQKEFIGFLEYLDKRISSSITTIHLVMDNVPTHHGKLVQKWLKSNFRFKFHFTPVHCSWMNQVEQWFSILQRKRFRIADFESKDDLRKKIKQFIKEWNQQAHPFNWSTKSVAKIMAKAPQRAAA